MNNEDKINSAIEKSGATEVIATCNSRRDRWEIKPRYATSADTLTVFPATETVDEIADAITRRLVFWKLKYHVKQHGGARPGAGRPPAKIARKSVRFSLSEEEKALVKKYIKSIRK